MSGANETVNGSGGHVGGEESLDESTDAWKCKCGTVNDPETEDLAEDADPDVCKTCGASAFEQDADKELTIEDARDAINSLTEEEIAAGLQNLW